MVKLELVLDIVGISHLSQAGLERCERVFGISATTKVYKRCLNCPIQQNPERSKKKYEILYETLSPAYFSCSSGKVAFSQVAGKAPWRNMDNELIWR